MNQQRRSLAALGVCMVLAPLPRISHAANKVYRVGWVSSLPLAQLGDTFVTFKKSLRELGYIEGQNVTFDVRSYEGNLSKLPIVAAEIVAQKPDVIVGSTDAVIRALREATKTVPIVMTFVPDPVRSGFSASLAHPGGNITGLSDIGSDLVGKKVELIRLIAPLATQIGVLTTDSASQLARLDAIRAAAKASGMAVHAELVLSADGLEKAFSSFAKQKVSAVIVQGGPPFINLRKELAALAIRFRIFTLSPTRSYVEAGGMLSYGANSTQQFELAAGYVDKILRGANPAVLPIQQPTTFELVINRKSANALGITLSPELLLRADEVIQ